MTWYSARVSLTRCESKVYRYRPVKEDGRIWLKKKWRKTKLAASWKVFYIHRRRGSTIYLRFYIAKNAGKRKHVQTKMLKYVERICTLSFLVYCSQNSSTRVHRARRVDFRYSGARAVLVAGMPFSQKLNGLTATSARWKYTKKKKKRKSTFQTEGDFIYVTLFNVSRVVLFLFYKFLQLFSPAVALCSMVRIRTRGTFTNKSQLFCLHQAYSWLVFFFIRLVSRFFFLFFSVFFLCILFNIFLSNRSMLFFQITPTNIT